MRKASGTGTFTDSNLFAFAHSQFGEFLCTWKCESGAQALFLTAVMVGWELTACLIYLHCKELFLHSIKISQAQV